MCHFWLKHFPLATLARLCVMAALRKAKESFANAKNKSAPTRWEERKRRSERPCRRMPNQRRAEGTNQSHDHKKRKQQREIPSRRARGICALEIVANDEIVTPSAGSEHKRPHRFVHAPKNNQGQIIPLPEVALLNVLNGEAKAIIIPRPRTGFRWVSCRHSLVPSILAAIWLGSCRKVDSEEQWQMERPLHRMMHPVRPFKTTYIVDIILCQQLITPIRYKLTDGAFGDHVYRAIGPNQLPRSIELALPQRFAPQCKAKHAEGSHT